MKAAVVTSFHAPLELQELPTPRPGPGKVLVRIEYSGLCHTDIHAANGDWPAKPVPPFTPGHEGIGIVEEHGSGVTAPALGSRVAIAWLATACGHCRSCIGGWETLCLSQQNSGYSVNGTFAEYAVVDAAFATAVPEGISPRDAAPLTCAGVTTYKAIQVAHVAPAETVAIFGIGGLGHLAVQYARIAGSLRRSSRHPGRQAGHGHRTGRRPRRQCRDHRSGAGDPGTRRRRRRRRPGRIPGILRSGVPLAAARWASCLRGAAR